VRAFNGADSVNSNEVQARSVASFSISSTSSPSSTSIQVNWPAATGATAYDVKYGTSSGSYTTVANQTSPYTITGLVTNTTYYIVVTGKNTTGSGSSTTSPEVTQITALSAPASLAASATPGSVSLTWGAVAGATSYKVYRGTTSGSHSEIANGVATNTYTDSTAANGTTYFYVVKAFNGADSANSNEISIRPINSFAITSVVPASPTSLTVTWPAVTGAATYDVKYSTTSGSGYTTLTNQTSPITITGLSSATTYYVVVVAKNAVGSGTAYDSSEIAASTSFGAPSGLTATATPTQVNLTWSSVVGATYNLYRGTASGSYTQIASGLTSASYSDSGVSNGTQYFYMVRADNGAESPDSNEATVKPISTFTLSSVTATSASSLNITWTAATGADAYDVRYGTSTGSYATTVSGVTSTYSLTGLSAGTTYYVIVRARNAIGAGTNQNSSELSTATSPAAPTGVAATATTGQIALSWTASTGATSYKVLRGTVSGSHTEIATGVATTSYTDTTVTNGTQYFYVVRASNGTDSVNSTEVTGKSIASFAITSAVAASASSIVVTFPATAGGDLYDVRYGTSTASYTTTASSVTSPYTITGLASGTTYYIVVRATKYYWI